MERPARSSADQARGQRQGGAAAARRRAPAQPSQPRKASRAARPPTTLPGGRRGGAAGASGRWGRRQRHHLFASHDAPNGPPPRTSTPPPSAQRSDETLQHGGQWRTATGGCRRRRYHLPQPACGRSLRHREGVPDTWHDRPAGHRLSTSAVLISCCCQRPVPRVGVRRGVAKHRPGAAALGPHTGLPTAQLRWHICSEQLIRPRFCLSCAAADDSALVVPGDTTHGLSSLRRRRGADGRA
jgi:hypothetical protein